jgi:hypothetical protein
VAQSVTANVGFVSRLTRLATQTARAATVYAVSRPALIKTLLILWRRHGFRPYEAHRDGLSNPALLEVHRSGTIPKRALHALQQRLNPPDLIGLVEDKAVFYAFCNGAGLRSAGLIAVLDDSSACNGEEVLRSGSDHWAETLDGCVDEIIVKPARGVYGQSVHIWKPTQEPRAAQPPGETAADLAERLHQEGWRRYVVQKRLFNDPALTDLTGSETLQTVRMQTLITSSGDCLLAGCSVKLAAGEGVTDNIAGGRTGNLAASVERTTGRLRVGLRPRPDGIGVDPVAEFPRTGRRIEGFLLPHWDEACDLACRAARAFLPLRTIGWDVALTPDGPVLVEGNAWWDPPNILCAHPAETEHAAEMANLLDQLRAEDR